MFLKEIGPKIKESFVLPFFYLAFLDFISTFLVPTVSPHTFEPCHVLTTLKLSENTTHFSYDHMSNTKSNSALSINLTDLLVKNIDGIQHSLLHPVYLSDALQSRPFTVISHTPSADHMKSTWYELTTRLPLDREEICNTIHRWRVARRCCSSQTYDQRQLSVFNQPCCLIIGLTVGSRGAYFIRIDVEDMNDFAPKFHLVPERDLSRQRHTISQPFVISLSENAEVGSRITLPCAVDFDEGMNGLIIYSTQLENPRTEFLQTFKIQQPSNTEVSRQEDDFPEAIFDRCMGPDMILLQSLDRERTASYKFKLIATDLSPMRPLSSFIDLVIAILDENDNSPIFQKDSYVIEVRENDVGNTLATIVVNDSDVGENSRLNFFLSSYGWTTNEFLRSHVQLIPSQSSVILKLIQPLDYEELKELKFNLVASDHGRPPRSSSVEIHIRVLDQNDLAPVIRFYVRGQQLDGDYANLVVPEDTQGKNPNTIEALLCHVHVSDGDSSPDDLQCDIVTPKQKFLLRESFIDNFVHKKKIYELLSTHILDREGQSTYSILVRCRDNTLPKFMVNQERLHLILSDVNDNPPIFTQSLYEGEVPENALNALVHLGWSGTLNKDSFNSGHIHATDKDAGGNAMIEYRIAPTQQNKFEEVNRSSVENSSTNADQSDVLSKFMIDPITGQLRTKVELDAELRQRYTFSVLAIDQASELENRMTATCRVSIRVTDSNDNPPVFDQRKYVFRLRENLPRITPIGTIKATDADVSEANRITVYEIQDVLDQNISQSVFIEPYTGQIRTQKVLDREELSELSFVVIARNSRSGPSPFVQSKLYDEAAVTLIIEDDNDNVPVMQARKSSPHKKHSDLVPSVVELEFEVTDENSLCMEFPYYFTDADEGENGIVRVTLERNPYFELRMDNTLLCQLNSDIIPGHLNLAIIVEDSPTDSTKVLKRRYVLHVGLKRNHSLNPSAWLALNGQANSSHKMPVSTLQPLNSVKVQPPDFHKGKTRLPHKNVGSVGNVTITIITALILISGLLCLLLLIVMFALRKTHWNNPKNPPVSRSESSDYAKDQLSLCNTSENPANRVASVLDNPYASLAAKENHINLHKSLQPREATIQSYTSGVYTLSLTRHNNLIRLPDRSENRNANWTREEAAEVAVNKMGVSESLAPVEHGCIPSSFFGTCDTFPQHQTESFDGEQWNTNGNYMKLLSTPKFPRISTMHSALISENPNEDGLAVGRNNTLADCPDCLGKQQPEVQGTNKHPHVCHVIPISRAGKTSGKLEFGLKKSHSLNRGNRNEAVTHDISFV